MPRRLIRAEGHDRDKTLWISLWWLETFTVHGPGPVVGEPTRLTDEYAGFVADCYVHDGRGKRMYDSAFFSRPKGCDKSGLSARLALFEALGPCRFAGWAKGGETYEFLGHVYTYAPGEAMGKAVTTPYVRVMATEEGQTGNVYDTIYYNLTNDEAPLSTLRAYGLDAGLTRIILPFGGEITPSTSGAASKDGGKETFVVFDETHLYITPTLRGMYDTVVRNLAKRRLEGTWFIEATTMYAPGQNSAAEATYDLAELIQQKRARVTRLLFDHRWGNVENLGDEDALRTAIREAYGDALHNEFSPNGWIDEDGIVNGIWDPRQSEVASRRYFLNAIVAAVNAWVTPELLLKVSEHFVDPEFRPLTPGDQITLGFDGSKNDDSTALVACRISDRLLFPLIIDEIPDGPEAEDWAVDRLAVDAAVHSAFELYEVVGFYADPPHWQDYVDAWAIEFGDQLRVHASGKHSIEWWTNREIAMVNALERLHTAMELVAMVFPRGTGLLKQFERHFLNAREWKRRAGSVIGKERKGGPLKMDAAIAATLAFEAAADFTAKPLPKKPSSFVPIQVR